MAVTAAVPAVLGCRAPKSSASFGFVPGGVTDFDDAIVGVANLDPVLLKALRQAATAAADDSHAPGAAVER
ncbi:hypothetical protein GTY65_09845 [Streptomyces sp. SID8379]|uniref:hypothetical protein n=1 Tax=unclassified Streptomyces TaxID=2593676 RepID=UPI0003744F74|nr:MULTISPECIES: hypothetical protein [unclassified Streptomyces]MYW64371.1 hypothetical protein [Streptomyces sp. SID8379]